MKIVAITGSVTACYGYRFFWPLNTLYSKDPENFTCVLTNVVDERMIAGDPRRNDPPADILVLLRDIHGPNLVAAANMRRDYGTRIVYDVDDNLFDLPPWNPVAKFFMNDDVRINIEHFLRHCDAITVSTEPLRQAYSKYNEHVYVLPNSIWAGVTVPRRAKNNRIPVVGWSGAIGHEMDFDRCRDALEALQETGEAYIKLFCNPDFPESPLTQNMPFVPWKGYYAVLAALDLDVGLAPLAPHRFNEHGKSNIRYLEYALAGTPIIASNVGPFAATIDHEETGILIEDDSEWLPWIRRLIAEPELADRLAANALEDVRARFDIEKNWMMWRKVYRDIVSRAPRKIEGVYMLSKTGLMVTTDTAFVRVMGPSQPRPGRPTTMVAVDPRV